MRRLLIVAVAVLLAFAAASVVMGIGLGAAALATPALSGAMLVDAVGLLLAHTAAGTAGVLMAMTVRAVWSALVTVCFVPVCLVAVMGEVAQRRLSLLASAVSTGVVTAALPLVLEAGSGPGTTTDPSRDGALFALLFVTGLAAGATFWLAAGRPARDAAQAR